MALSRTFIELIVGGSAADIDFASIDSSSYDALLVYAEGESTTSGHTVDDDKGNTWTPLTEARVASPSTFSRLFYSNLTSKGASHVVSTHNSGAGLEFQRVAIWGITATGGIALDDESVASGTGSGGVMDAGSLTTSAAALLFMGGNLNAPDTHTQGSGWTLRNGTNTIVQDRSEATGGTFDPTSTHTGSADYAAVSAAFTEVGGGGGGVLSSRLTLMGVGR